MGPQHPSTHGVLRLVLELEGETVQQARSVIGYLHTGIEKNCEYRTWTQGVTFVTRADYLAPIFNEVAYCLAVEKLLGVEAPRRATVARVLLMELNRIGSHLVCLATGGMELGALTGMTAGFREREEVLHLLEFLTGLRMNHAYVRPGGLAQDFPEGWAGEGHRVHRGDALPAARLRQAAHRPADLAPAPGEGRLPAGRRLPGARRHRPDPAQRRAGAGTCARSSRTAATRSTTSRCRRPPRPTATPATGCGSPRCTSRSRSWSRPSTKMEPGPVMVDDRKIAWPAQLSVGSDGMGNTLEHVRKIMGQSMESLIHHFKLVTEGFQVPAGQVYVPVESPRGELGYHLVSDGGTRPVRVHVRDPSFVNLQTMPAMSEGGMVADVIAAVASIDPVMGGVDR